MVRIKLLFIFLITLSTHVCYSLSMNRNDDTTDSSAVVQQTNKEKCRYFNGNPGSCKYGDNCKFLHTYSAVSTTISDDDIDSWPIVQQTNKEKCRYFNGNPGSCKYGDNCKFFHAYSAVSTTLMDIRHREKEQKEFWRVADEAYKLGIITFSETYEKNFERGQIDELTRAIERQKNWVEEKALELGVSTLDAFSRRRSTYEIKADVEREEARQYEERQRQEKKRVEQEALELGVSTLMRSTEEIKAAIRLKKKEHNEKRQAQYEEIRKHKTEQYEKSIRQKAEKLGISTYAKSSYLLEEEILKRTGSNSQGRMVGDGRGGRFFAVWGKDDN